MEIKRQAVISAVIFLSTILFLTHQVWYSYFISFFNVFTFVPKHIEQKQEPASFNQIFIKEGLVSYEIPSKLYVAQTFNNCGPATLSMAMAVFDKVISQKDLADQMRPFHNPYGGIDDKSINADEFVEYAENYGFMSLHRPNGTIFLIEKLVTNDIPVVVRTWLNSKEDIGHFRLVRGFNKDKKYLIVDDSYYGPSINMPYQEFMDIWKPFNYSYILVFPKEKKELVSTILGDEINEKKAYQNALQRAYHQKNNMQDTYVLFNLATAYYYLGDYQKSVYYFEQSKPYLPKRMLWYQYEPIISYLKLGDIKRVFALSDEIFNSGNIAFSEMYYFRGEAYLKQNEKDLAKQEYEKAVFYNKNFNPAKERLKRL